MTLADRGLERAGELAAPCYCSPSAASSTPPNRIRIASIPSLSAWIVAVSQLLAEVTINRWFGGSISVIPTPLQDNRRCPLLAVAASHFLQKRQRSEGVLGQSVGPMSKFSTSVMTVMLERPCQLAKLRSGCDWRCHLKRHGPHVAGRRCRSMFQTLLER